MRALEAATLAEILYRQHYYVTNTGRQLIIFLVGVSLPRRYRCDASSRARGYYRRDIWQRFLRDLLEFRASLLITGDDERHTTRLSASAAYFSRHDMIFRSARAASLFSHYRHYAKRSSAGDIYDITRASSWPHLRFSDDALIGNFFDASIIDMGDIITDIAAMGLSRNIGPTGVVGMARGSAFNRRKK